MAPHPAPRRRRTARRLLATSAGLVTGILVTGLLAAPAQAQSRTGTSPGPDAPIGTVARTVGDARFEPGPCPKTPEPVEALDGARCGTLTVPENRAGASGRTIRLGVAIVPAATGKPTSDPIVWLAGGPGDDAVGEAKMAIDGGLNRDRDVIFMSQRGTYSADPDLLCPEIDEFNARSVGLEYDAPSTGRLHVEATKACREKLAGRGIDLSAYNDTESAADYEDLRKALGIDKWNLYGISYGTHLALVYMRLHPEDSARSASTAYCHRRRPVRPRPGAAPARASTACSRPARRSRRATSATRTCRPPSTGSSATSKPSRSPPPSPSPAATSR